jgi:hypothetical protein
MAARSYRNARFWRWHLRASRRRIQWLSVSPVNNGSSKANSCACDDTAHLA